MEVAASRIQAHEVGSHGRSVDPSGRALTLAMNSRSPSTWFSTVQGKPMAATPMSER